jgi:hypothetical protein
LYTPRRCPVPKTRTLLSLIGVPLLALLIACGGSDKDSSSSSSGSDNGSSSGQSSSGSSGQSGDDRSTDGVSLENCKEYTNFAVTAASAFGATSSTGQFKLDKSALDKMVKASPKEIRSDMQTVVGALVSYFEVLEKAGLTDPSKLDPAKLQAAQADLEKAAAKMDDKKVQEAADRIEAFFEKNCK